MTKSRIIRLGKIQFVVSDQYELSMVSETEVGYRDRAGLVIVTALKNYS